jgi:hypothetical protein
MLPTCPIQRTSLEVIVIKIFGDEKKFYATAKF